MTQSRKRIVTGLDNAKFVKLCTQNGVDFLLVGGAAVLHYGCREDGVTETDIMVNRMPENADRIMNVLTQAGVRVDFTSRDLQRPKVQLPIKRYDYFLDLLTPWLELSYSDLRGRAEAGLLNSTEVQVVSKEDLIKMKEYAVDQLESEADKHRKDIRCLKAL